MKINPDVSLRIGLLINPYAGIGGPAGCKGSDNLDANERENHKKRYARANERACIFLTFLSQAIMAYSHEEHALSHAHSSLSVDLFFVTGDMGSTTVNALKDSKTLAPSIQCHEVTTDIASSTSAVDTKHVTQLLCDMTMDIIVFVGGDGTARDVCDVVNNQQLVLGVPSGVKMHSGVFAIDAQAAADIVNNLLCGDLVATHIAEVRDIDENLLRAGKVNSTYYGDMRIPAQHEYIQAVKQGGLEVEELVLLDICHDVQERIIECDDTLFIFAPGTTCHFILQELGFASTLLGFDVVCNNAIVASDVNADDLLHIIAQHQSRVPHRDSVRLILTPIGGQGYLIGRGNQQLTPAILKRIGKDNVWVVSTKTKLENLSHRLLHIDSNDLELDAQWAGFIPVITGYHDEILYRVGRALTE